MKKHVQRAKRPQIFFGGSGLPTQPLLFAVTDTPVWKRMGVGILRAVDHRHDIARVTKTDLALFALQDMVKRLGPNHID